MRLNKPPVAGAQSLSHAAPAGGVLPVHRVDCAEAIAVPVARDCEHEAVSVEGDRAALHGVGGGGGADDLGGLGGPGAAGALVRVGGASGCMGRVCVRSQDKRSSNLKVRAIRRLG